MIKSKKFLTVGLVSLVLLAAIVHTESYELEEDEQKAHEKYEKRRQELKNKHAEHKKRKSEDEKLADGEEWTKHEKYEREDSEEELHPDMFTRETFFAEYDTASPTHPEVKMAKRYFPTKDSSIDKERYKSLMKMFMDGTVHENPIDEDIREEAHKQLEEFLDQFVDSKEKDEFTIEDLFSDYIEGKFHDWVDLEHPQSDPDIEPDL